MKICNHILSICLCALFSFLPDCQELKEAAPRPILCTYLYLLQKEKLGLFRPLHLTCALLMPPPKAASDDRAVSPGAFQFLAAEE